MPKDLFTRAEELIMTTDAKYLIMWPNASGGWTATFENGINNMVLALATGRDGMDALSRLCDKWDALARANAGANLL